MFIGERERANLIVQLARIFYIITSALLRAAWNVRVRVFCCEISYAYLELRRAWKLRVLIGQNSAHSGMHKSCIETTRRSLRSLAIIK